jgi:hypothetical protein
MNLAQNFGVGSIAVGESGLQVVRYGAGQARLTGSLRIDNGVLSGNLTTTQRDALPSGARPPGLVIYNTTTGRLEQNFGTDATPNWQPTNFVPTGTTLPSNPVDGQRFRLRVGTTPFSFINLVYDGTYTKWASEEHSLLSTGRQTDPYWVWTATGIALAGAIVPMFKLSVNAGLQLQLRLTGVIQGTNSANFNTGLRIDVLHQDVGATGIPATLNAQLALIDGYPTANNTWVARDTGWASASITSPKDMAFIQASSSGGFPQTVTFFGGLWMRWVSQ